MTEGHDQEHLAEASASAPVTDQPLAERSKSVPNVHGIRRTAFWLAALLALVIAAIGSSPFWARDVAPLLPWAGPPAAPTEDYAALAARLEAIEKRSPPPSPDIGSINSTTNALARRVDQLESALRQRYCPVRKIGAGAHRNPQHLRRSCREVAGDRASGRGDRQRAD